MNKIKKDLARQKIEETIAALDSLAWNGVLLESEADEMITALNFVLREVLQ